MTEIKEQLEKIRDEAKVPKLAEMRDCETTLVLEGRCLENRRLQPIITKLTEALEKAMEHLERYETVPLYGNIQLDEPMLIMRQYAVESRAEVLKILKGSAD